VCGWSTLTRDETAFRIGVALRVVERGERKPRPLSQSELIEVLLHEWAHCLAWSSGNVDLHDHSPGWGVSYAECYRATIED
jgi:predicted metallopeptidase